MSGEIRFRAAVWPLLATALLTALTLAVWFHEHWASAEDLDALVPRVSAAEKSIAVQSAVSDRVETKVDRIEGKVGVGDCAGRALS